jgi:hypothetical protein
MSDSTASVPTVPSVEEHEATAPVGASVWARELWGHLTEHGRREGELLDAYVEAAGRTGSAALRYVVELLAEDERRHHRQFEQLASSLKADAELDPDGPAIPRLDFHRAGEAVRGVTRHLLAQERADLAALKRLRRQLRDVEDTTLWALLVDQMELDTVKHITLLEFVDDHTPVNA